MWSKGIGVAIIFLSFLKIACVTMGDNVTADSRIKERFARKVYTYLFQKGSWFEAYDACVKKDMQLASFNSKMKPEILVDVGKLDIGNEVYWIYKPYMAQKEKLIWTEATNLPNFVKGKPINQCFSWLWMRTEVCASLRPYTNEWIMDDCNKEKYVLCEGIGDELFGLIQSELFDLIEEMMFSGFAESLPTAEEKMWVDLVKGGLGKWMEEQKKSTYTQPLLHEVLVQIVRELLKMEVNSFSLAEIREYLNKKVRAMNDDDRMSLIDEIFRDIIEDGYNELVLKEPQLNSFPSNEIIGTLAKEVKKYAMEMKLAKTTPSSSVNLDYEQLETYRQQLLEFSEVEFNHYVYDIRTHIQDLGIDEADRNLVYQLYVFVKKELFLVIAKTIIKSTYQERIEIAEYGLNKILKGENLVEEYSVFGQVFVSLSIGLGVLINEQYVSVLDGNSLMGFVKSEFDGLKHEDMLNLQHEGYIKFIIDQIIELVNDRLYVNKEAGDLPLDKFVALIANEFFFYSEYEMKALSERLDLFLGNESKQIQIIAEQAKTRLANYDQEKLFELFQLVQQELHTSTVNSLVRYSDTDIYALAETTLTKIVGETFVRLVETRAIIGKVFVSLENEISKMSDEVFAGLKKEEQLELVKLELEKTEYQKNIKLFIEMYTNLIGEEFIKLIKSEAVKPRENETQFGEMVRLLAKKLTEIKSKGK